MKVWVWNAFASNNSGSYTIVGSFPSQEEAQRVAAELGAVMKAHSEWMATEGRVEPSPLETFIRKNGLTWKPGLGARDDWPAYGGKDAPDAVAVGHQVAVHHEYTVTMPRTFGELFYARGGRVDVEIDHGHHPTVAIFEMWIGWQERQKVDVAARVAELEKALAAEEVRAHLAENLEPIVRPSGGEFGDADLSFAAVFGDLAAGFAAVDERARASGFTLRVRVLEAFDDDDPLGFLR